jgi:predicted DNA-binding protein (UPF0251 family)
MPRPIKWRCVTQVPPVTYFKPAGQPLRALEEVALTVEEVEALRLKDLEGLEQESPAPRSTESFSQRAGRWPTFWSTARPCA